ncbi:MAG: PilZ domain-containing protein [Sphingomicrobium sp.]
MGARHLPREHRLSVVLPARMKDNRGWHDVRILNISSKGLMARSAAAPSRGSYLELRRGSHVIVARVVWSNGQQFGVQSQSRLVPSQVIEEQAGAVSPPARPGSCPAVERRASPRLAGHAHEQSRWRARALEFLGIVAMVAILGVLALDVSQQALAHSMNAVNKSLGSANSGQGL